MCLNFFWDLQHLQGQVIEYFYVCNGDVGAGFGDDGGGDGGHLEENIYSDKVFCLLLL